MHRKSSRGYSLAEMLVAVAVLSLILSLGVPSYSNLVLNNRQVGTVNELVASLQLARSEAITRNQRVTVCSSDNGVNCIAPSWSSGVIVFVDTDGNRQVNGTDTLLREVDGFDNLDVNSAGFDNFLVYRPNGRMMTDNLLTNSGQFSVCDQRGPTYGRVLAIDVSGRPRSVHHEPGGEPVPGC